VVRQIWQQFDLISHVQLFDRFADLSYRTHKESLAVQYLPRKTDAASGLFAGVIKSGEEKRGGKNS
jgi:hypothetical protein